MIKSFTSFSNPDGSVGGGDGAGAGAGVVGGGGADVGADASTCAGASPVTAPSTNLDMGAMGMFKFTFKLFGGNPNPNLAMVGFTL